MIVGMVSQDNGPSLFDFRELARKVLEGGPPVGEDFDACRAVVRDDPGSGPAFQAMCMLLEGALAEPTLSSEDTQVLVPLLKNLAMGLVRVGDLV